MNAAYLGDAGPVQMGRETSGSLQVASLNAPMLLVERAGFVEVFTPQAFVAGGKRPIEIRLRGTA